MRGEEGEVRGEGKETSRVEGGHTLRALTRGRSLVGAAVATGPARVSCTLPRLAALRI